MRPLPVMAALLLPATLSFAQIRFPYKNVAQAIDSGWAGNQDIAARVVFSRTVRVQGATWLKLYLDGTELERDSMLLLTSLEDGAWQFFETWSLRAYRNASATFNGDAVRVQLVAGSFTTRNRVRIVAVDAGEAFDVAGMASQCGPQDDRVPSNDKRAARQFPTGCTTWLIGKFAGLTAGHCTRSAAQQMHFNVPPSSSGGRLRQPHPDDQYPYDTSSLRRLAAGVGSDWAVFATVRNSNHGQYPGERQGAWFQLGTPPARGTIRITGYGVDRDQRDRNQVQQTHTGPLSFLSGSRLCYVVDTEGGNSGSPVILEATGEAVGIHTHGGCSTSGSGCNSGTALNRSDLAAAIQAVLDSRVAGSYEPFGAGCRGTNGVPSLAHRGIPEIGRTLTIQMSNLPQQSAAVLQFGVSDRQWGQILLPLKFDSFGAPGCAQFVSVEVLRVVATGTGSSSTLLPIPNSRGLIGTRWFNQVLCLDKNANQAGVTTSNAAKATIGGIR